MTPAGIIQRLLVPVAVAAAIAWAVPAAAQSLRVIDGDTIQVRGNTVRIIGLDAPEIHGRCPSEIRMALAARDRLRQLLAGGFAMQARGRDRYGRTLGVVTDSAGRDVAAVLIAEGLARPYSGRSRRQGWC